MQISVKLIATYRQLLPEGTPGNTIALQVAPGTRLEDVLARFALPNDNESVILVNGRVPQGDPELVEGDQVVAFPAMAGG